MLNKIILSIFFIVCSISTCTAMSISTLTIINHYPGPLLFNVQQNAQVVPDLKPRIFTLAKNASKKTIVFSQIPDMEAYIKVDGVNEKLQQIIAFWGVDSFTGVRGYIGQGLAYSWDNSDDAVIVFCHPRDYPCLNTRTGVSGK